MKTLHAVRQAAWRTAAVGVVLVVLIGTACTGLPTPEPHAKFILDEIEQTRHGIERFARQGEHPCVRPGCVFLAFWDFDGTILDGDITEGLERDGRKIYSGLQEQLINAGFSPRFSGPDAFARYQQAYLRLENEQGYAVAYAFIAAAFAGGDVKAIEAFIEPRIEAFRPHYFASSVAILQALEDRGVHNHIVSASPDFYVKAAAASLGLGKDRVHGIRLAERDGRYTAETSPPIHWGPGKVARIEAIIRQEKQAAAGRHVYVIAAFGNSPHSDGPFLEWVRSQKLPVRNPVAVMINGGTGPQNPELLYVSQTATIGPHH